MTRIVIVGAGRGGTALLELFAGDPSVRLLGMVDINERAPGMERARALGIPTATDYKEFLRDSAVDLIVDVTGNPEVSRTLWQLKPESAEVMGGTTAKFLWGLIEERHRKAALERLHVQQESRGTPELEEGFGRAKERVIAAFEREAITRYLQQTGGNISRAATVGGTTRRTFHRLLMKHGISHRQFKPDR
jgi:hypothetical protein